MPFSLNSKILSVSGLNAKRFGVPGIPPGRIIIFALSKSASLNSLSAFMVTLCELVTSRESVMETMSIVSPARRTISTTVSISTSSYPGAKKISASVIKYYLHN